MSEGLRATLGLLGPLDWVALVAFFTVSIALRLLIERPHPRRVSTSRLVADYRREWMQAAAAREIRIMDATLLGSMRNGSAFFASGTMIVIGGLFAGLGQAERLILVAQDIGVAGEATRRLWELKLVFMLVLMVDAFLKFVWSHRVFGYCQVMLGTMPDTMAPDERSTRADRAGWLLILAGRSFNRGLRAVYFTLSVLGWFLGPVAFLIALTVTAGVIYRREFLSETRRVLM